MSGPYGFGIGANLPLGVIRRNPDVCCFNCGALHPRGTLCNLTTDSTRPIGGELVQLRNEISDVLATIERILHKLENPAA